MLYVFNFSNAMNETLDIVMLHLDRLLNKLSWFKGHLELRLYTAKRHGFWVMLIAPQPFCTAAMYSRPEYYAFFLRLQESLCGLAPYKWLITQSKTSVVVG